MTKQEIFDRVVAGLAAQGWVQSTEGQGGARCRYRGDNGRKCAVGQLIADECYDVGWLEGRGASHEFVQNAIARSLGFDLTGTPGVCNLLTDMQIIHDCCSDPTDMRGRFADCARKNGLTFSEVGK